MVKFCDSNRNNQIDIGDAQYIASNLAGIQGYNIPKIDFVDVNKNNKIDIGDAQFIASFLAGISVYNIPDININSDIIFYNKNLESDISNYLVDTSHNKIFSDLSLSLQKYNENSDFFINLNLDYLVSNYPDTYLKIELYYDYSNNETKIGESILGTGNTTLLKNNYNFNKIINVDIPAYSLVNFYTKLSYININNLDLSDNYKPEIILNNHGNNIFVIEV